MYFVDYHMHSSFSSDCGSKPEEMVQSAISRGLYEVAFTDHIEEDYPPVSYHIEEKFDYDEYSSEIERLRERYEGVIRIKKGVEIGLQVRAVEGINQYFSGKEFDFIIGSTHAVDYKDLYDETFFIGKTKHEALREYFDDVCSSVSEFDMYHVYGHLDAVARYGPYTEKAFDYAPYSEIIERILKLLIEKGKGIEINSSGLRYGLPEAHPQIKILRRYKELGGEIITIGSDAHRPEHVAYGFGVLYKTLKDVGFKAITTFDGGVPAFVDIK